MSEAGVAALRELKVGDWIRYHIERLDAPDDPPVEVSGDVIELGPVEPVFVEDGKEQIVSRTARIAGVEFPMTLFSSADFEVVSGARA